MQRSSFLKIIIVFIISLFVLTALKLSLKTLPFKINELLTYSNQTRIDFEKYDKSFKNELDFSILISKKTSFDHNEITKVLKTTHKHLRKFPFIKNMTSLYNGEYFKINGDYIRLTPFTGIDQQLSPDFIQKLEKPFLKNLFISDSKKSLLISGQFIDFENISTERENLKTFVKQIKALDEHFKELNVHVIGTKVAQYYYFLETIRNQSFLTPLLFLCLALIIFYLFRSFKILTLFLTIMLVSYSSIVYLITLNEGGISTYSGFAMFFILVVATSDLVHYFNSYAQNSKTSIEEKIKLTHKHVYIPCFLTSLTTALCFVSLIPNSVIPISNIGIYASVGSILCFVYTFYLLPFLLRVFQVQIHKSHRLSSFKIGVLLDFVLKYPSRTIVFFFSLSLIFIYFSQDLKVDDDFYTKFADNHPLTKSVHTFQKEFQSLGSIDLTYKFSDGHIHDLKNHEQVLKFEKELEMTQDISYIKSYSSFYNYVRQAFSDIPESSSKEKRIQSLVNLMKSRNVFSNFHNEKSGLSRSIVFIKSTSSLATVKALKSIKNVAKKYDPFFTVKEQGFVSIRSYVFNKLTTNFAISFLFSLLSIFIIFLFIFKSLSWSLIGLLPNIFPLLLIGGALGLLGFSIDSNLVLMICITLGIAVDDTIHFLWALKNKTKQTDKASMNAAIISSFESTNKALLGTTLIFALSFPCFFLAELKIFYQVGSFVIISLIFALAADFLLLPALLSRLSPKK